MCAELELSGSRPITLKLVIWVHGWCRRCGHVARHVGDEALGGVPEEPLQRPVAAVRVGQLQRERFYVGPKDASWPMHSCGDIAVKG